MIFVPEIICEDCGKRMFHENEDTLKIEEAIHKKFCRKKEGKTQSYMHRDASDTTTFDVERQYDLSGSPILKK